jgi:hypothetical protein
MAVNPEYYEQDQPQAGMSESSMYTQQPMGNYSAIQLRLDTLPYLQQIEEFLRGYKMTAVLNENTGQVDMVKSSKLGTAKANEVGVNNVMAFCTGVFNAQISQANFLDAEHYWKEVEQIHISFAKTLWINMENWGVKENDYPLVMDVVMNTVRIFLTRCLFNKERESLSTTVKTLETNTLGPRKGFGLFGK